MPAIAPPMGRPHRTSKKYLAASPVPARPPRRGPPSILAPYKASRLERGQAGGRSVLELDRELQAQGLAGKYSSGAAYVGRLRPPQGRSPRRCRAASPATIVEVDKPLTPRRPPCLVLRPEAQRHDDAKPQRARLQAHEGAIAVAITLTQDFAGLVRQPQPGQLETWRERATASGLQAVKRLATGGRADYEAGKAGLTLPWSTGPVEGPIKRLQMLKRQRYGRAPRALLRQRVLVPT